MNSNDVDLGSGYSYRFVGWHPDRSIAANFKQYHDVQDIDKCGLILTCPHGDGMIHFDLPAVHRVFPKATYWEVKSWEPLTLEPSILRNECGCHGFIREGKWVNA